MQRVGTVHRARPQQATADVNGDGEVNIADVNRGIHSLLNGSHDAASDVDNDGEVSVGDINAIISIILSGTIAH